MEYDGTTKKLRVRGRFGYESGVKVRKVIVLGEEDSTALNGATGQIPLGRGSGGRAGYGRTVDVHRGLNEGFTVYID